MSKPQDGFVSKFVNRPISRRLTRILLKFPIDPNTWTVSILLLPLFSCVLLFRGDYMGIVAATLIFQCYSILDGCDGEIARAKNLESRFGEQLDTLCDSVASVLFLVALGAGLRRFGEGTIAAACIIASEWLTRSSRQKSEPGVVHLDDSFYRRHHAMIARSGLLNLGQKAVWWIFQLTKRDVAVLLFLLLALMNRPNLILHLWLSVAAGTLVLHCLAMTRANNPTRKIDLAVSGL